MRSFAHQNATTLADAVAWAEAGEGKTCWIAGGTDLLGVLKDDLLPDYPATVVNLKTLQGLGGIEADGEGLRLGALTKLVDLVRNPLVQERFPALAAAAAAVATPEIRNMGTLGGNLCQDTRCWYYRYPHHMGGRMLCLRKGKGPCHAVHGDNRYHVVIGGKGCFAPCPSDTAVALALLGATLESLGPDGPRSTPLHDFYTPLGMVLGPHEILTAVVVPATPAGFRQRFRKFTVRKPVDFAVVSVAVGGVLDAGVCRAARMVLGGVAPWPYRDRAAEAVLVGKAPTAEVIAQAARGVLEQARPLSGNAYKVEIARNLVREELAALFD